VITVSRNNLSSVYMCSKWSAEVRVIPMSLSWLTKCGWFPLNYYPGILNFSKEGMEMHFVSWYPLTSELALSLSLPPLLTPLPCSFPRNCYRAINWWHYGV